MYYQPEPTLLTIASGEQGVVEEQVGSFLKQLAKPKYSSTYKIKLKTCDSGARSISYSGASPSLDS